jgi:CheY-like chemotaxis protein
MTELEQPPFTTPRRAPRYYFGGAVELTDLESGRMMVALVRTLSLFGCFVKTKKPLIVGTRVKLTITDSGSHFSALGRVANQRNDGVGIEFTEVGPSDQACLKDCLAELAETVTLPTRSAPEPLALPPAQVSPSTNVHTSGVLVVDDHSVTRNTIRSLLTWHSFPVCGEAENGKQAVEKVKELRPEVVLLDIEMPEMNGIQAAHEIRRIAPSTKILFFTIHKDEALSGARLMGAEGCVTKSAAGTELIPALKRLFANHEAISTGNPVHREMVADEKASC